MAGGWGEAKEMTNDLIPIGDEQSKAILALSGFGTTVVEEGGKLAGYLGIL
jgi:hypothetical protein